MAYCVVVETVFNVIFFSLIIKRATTLGLFNQLFKYLISLIIHPLSRLQYKAISNVPTDRLKNCKFRNCIFNWNALVLQILLCIIDPCDHLIEEPFLTNKVVIKKIHNTIKNANFEISIVIMFIHLSHVDRYVGRILTTVSSYLRNVCISNRNKD